MQKITRRFIVALLPVSVALSLTGAPAKADYPLEEFKKCLADAKDNHDRSECFWKRVRSQGATR